MSNRKMILIIISICLVFGITGQVYALTFPTENYIRYGDFWSYSLPILNIINGDKPDKGPYTIDSSPGKIKDDIVIYTFPEAAQDNWDTTGAGTKKAPIYNADDAYIAVTGTDKYFSTSMKPLFPDPGGSGQFFGDTNNTWDIKLNALNTFLGDSDLLFFFNNNQTGSGISESLYAWGRATLVDIDGGLPSLYFDFTNNPPFGEPNGDVTTYTSTGTSVLQPGGSLPVDLNYVFVPGQILYSGETINHNLGQDNAAYALFSPEINNILKMPDFNGYDVMQIDMRLDMLNDGYEQLFIQAGHNVTNVTEPSTLILLGSGLLGLGFYARRRRPKL